LFNSLVTTSPPTPSKILNAAESLFAQYGFARVTLRQITTQAGVNLAAVNYHYYDKESLYRDLLCRRLQQLNHRRTALLDQAETGAIEGVTPLSAIMDALARPAFLPEGEFSPASARLIGRVLLERNPLTAELLEREFQPLMTRFGQALRRHQPGLPPADFLWRFSFIVGALHHGLVTLPDMPALTHGICRENDAETALSNFTRFAVSAMR
jgi:AcrR family transcriptional regulator